MRVRRPWRLDLPPNVVWVDIDEPELLDMKRTQLQAAGAATGQQQQQAECAPPRFPLRAAAYHMLDCKVRCFCCSHPCTRALPLAPALLTPRVLWPCR